MAREPGARSCFVRLAPAAAADEACVAVESAPLPFPLIMGRLGLDYACGGPFVVSTCFGSFGTAARTFLSGLSFHSRARGRLPPRACDLGAGAALCAIPSYGGRRLFGASVGRRLPPCALAEVAAGCGMNRGWRWAAFRGVVARACGVVLSGRPG